MQISWNTAVKYGNLYKRQKLFLAEIINVCDKNGLITVDCLKDENMISVEEYNAGDLGDCIFEFKRIKENLFKLIWQEI